MKEFVQGKGSWREVNLHEANCLILAFLDLSSSNWSVPLSILQISSPVRVRRALQSPELVFHSVRESLVPERKLDIFTSF